VIDAAESARVTEARARAGLRLQRRRDSVRPLALLVTAAVVVGAVNGHPAPGLHGSGLGVTLALCAFAATLAGTIATTASQGSALQAALLAGMAAAGIALTALQPHDATVFAGGAAVFIAVARLRWPLGAGLAIATTAGLDLAAALAGGSATAVLAISLLCALLGVVAFLVEEARAGQTRTELLLAQLEDAREEQLEAAAVTERGRIAAELHDVLAHSLSGAALQLQGARMLAEREGASAPVREAIDRASGLVKAGLGDARRAVGALRGEDLPGVDQLDALVESARRDVGVDATLTIEGDVRALPADVGLALYRGVQEALTNVARHAPGAATTVVLRFEPERTTVAVENGRAAANALLTAIGGGHGLEGMRERLARVGGGISAGPTDRGWRVELDVPV
jgi:signal transduction histidine kinase